MDKNSLRVLLARLKGSRAAQLVALLAVVLLGGGTAALVVDTDGPDGPSAAHTVTLAPGVLGLHGAELPPDTPVSAKVDSADPGRAPDVKVTAPADVIAAQANTLEQALHAEDPTDANVEAQDQAAHDDQLPIVTADAAPSQRGCLSRFVQNYSSRRGVAPRLLVLHETVTPDRRGWSDVNAIGVQFNSVSSQASSTYTLDREAHCLYLVRESDKPWTQASANPWSISFEIINLANGAYARNLIDGPGRKLLLGILNDASKRWNIPLRAGRTSGCRPTRAGIIDHYSLGPCGGGHVDVTPFRRSVAPLIVDARRLCQTRYRSAHKRVPSRCRA